MQAPIRSLAALALLAGLAACGEEGDNPLSAASTSVANAAESAAAEAAPAINIDELKSKGYAMGDIVLGQADAPVTLIEYASLTCPACRAFHANTLPAIKKNYISTGKVKMVVREVHGARIGLYAAALARCAGPDRYHAFLDVLFQRQPNYITQDPNANIAELRRIGKIGGLSTERVEACLNDNVYLNAIYRESLRNLEVDEVPATPFLILQPGEGQQTFRGAVGPDRLGEAIDGLLADAGKTE